MLKDKYDYENTEKWYGICKCDKVSIEGIYGYSIWLFYVVVFGALIAVLLSLDLDDGSLIMGILVVPFLAVLMASILNNIFEKWFAYKKHKKFYDEYVKNTGECLEEFSYRMFYDIKSDYEEYVKKVAELDAEKEKALNRIAY